jgi:hypothetical protein
VTSVFYDNGLDILGGGSSPGSQNWGNANFRLMLVKDTMPVNRSHVVVADLLPGTYECDGAGYAGRTNVTGMVRTVNNTTHKIAYTCDDPNLGNVAPGESLNLVVYLLITDDTNSILVAFIDLGGQPTDGSNFIVAMPAGGLFDTVQG